MLTEENCKTENMAVKRISGLNGEQKKANERERERERHTGNDHGLTAHDKDDLHRPELTHTKLPAPVDCVPELSHEDNAEVADAHCHQNRVDFLKPQDGVKGLSTHDQDTAPGHLSQTEPDVDDGQRNRNGEHGEFLPSQHVSSHNSGLRDERGFHDCFDQRVCDLHQNTVCEIPLRRVGDVAGKIGISFKECPGIVHDLANQAKHVEKQREDVEAKHNGRPLLGSGQQRQQHERNHGGSELSAVVDAADDPFLDVLVELGDGDVHGTTVTGSQGDILSERIKRHFFFCSCLNWNRDLL